jgi:hypothetical protein
LHLDTHEQIFGRDAAKIVATAGLMLNAGQHAGGAKAPVVVSFAAAAL